MDIGLHTKKIIRQIKQGIDDFNLEHQNKGLIAFYPYDVEIEHDGVKMRVPLMQQPTGKKE